MYTESSVFTEFNATEKKVEYAGFWLRFVAALLDGIILCVPAAIIQIIFGIGFFSRFFKHAQNTAFLDSASYVKIYLITTMIQVMIQFFYYTFMESSHRQATIGKIALGIKVTDLRYERISYGRAAGRFFLKNIYFTLPTLLLTTVDPGTMPYIQVPLFLIGFVAYCIAGWTTNKQALHDMFAGTYVIKKSPYEVIQQEEPVEGY